MAAAFDQLKVAGLTLEGVAQGGVQTSIRVPELKLLFDVGRGGGGMLKYDQVLLSHGHQDHAGGLPYIISQRGMMGKGPLQVHLPEELAPPLRRILDAWSEIEGFELQYELHPHAPGDVFELQRDLEARAIRTVHRVPSLAYLVSRVTQKLKAEFQGRPGSEIGALKAEGVDITEAQRTPLICVTGDTQIEFLLDNDEARKAQILVHEVTAWDARRSVAQIREWGHTHVEEMIAHAEKFEGEALVLVHRSLRHDKRFAEQIVRERFPASVRDRVHVFGG